MKSASKSSITLSFILPESIAFVKKRLCVMLKGCVYVFVVGDKFFCFFYRNLENGIQQKSSKEF